MVTYCGSDFQLIWGDRKVTFCTLRDWSKSTGGGVGPAKKSKGWVISFQADEKEWVT